MMEDILSCVRIRDVYHTLTGRQPHRTGRDTWRAVATWRDGDGLNVSGDDARGVWHDFAANEGGGVLDLIVRVRGGLDLQYGRIERLHIRDGEPVLDPTPEVIQPVKFGAGTAEAVRPTLYRRLARLRQAFLTACPFRGGAMRHRSAQKGDPVRTLVPSADVSNIIEQVTSDGRRWFEEHPGASCRERSAVVGAYRPVFDSRSVLYVVVTQVRPGWQLRLPVVRLNRAESERVQ